MACPKLRAAPVINVISFEIPRSIIYRLKKLKWSFKPIDVQIMRDLFAGIVSETMFVDAESVRVNNQVLRKKALQRGKLLDSQTPTRCPDSLKNRINLKTGSRRYPDN